MKFFAFWLKLVLAVVVTTPMVTLWNSNQREGTSRTWFAWSIYQKVEGRRDGLLFRCKERGHDRGETRSWVMLRSWETSGAAPGGQACCRVPGQWSRTCRPAPSSCFSFPGLIASGKLRLARGTSPRLRFPPPTLVFSSDCLAHEHFLTWEGAGHAAPALRDICTRSETKGTGS